MHVDLNKRDGFCAGPPAHCVTPGARPPRTNRDNLDEKRTFSVPTHPPPKRLRAHADMANNDPSERRILPQSSQMNSFSFAPSVYQQPPQETQQRSEFSCFRPERRTGDTTNRAASARGHALLSARQQCMQVHARACAGTDEVLSDRLNISNNSPLADYVFVDEHNRHKRLKGKADTKSCATAWSRPEFANRACRHW